MGMPMRTLGLQEFVDWENEQGGDGPWALHEMSDDAKVAMASVGAVVSVVGRFVGFDADRSE